MFPTWVDVGGSWREGSRGWVELIYFLVVGKILDVKRNSRFRITLKTWSARRVLCLVICYGDLLAAALFSIEPSFRSILLHNRPFTKYIGLVVCTYLNAEICHSFLRGPLSWLCFMRGGRLNSRCLETVEYTRLNWTQPWSPRIDKCSNYINIYIHLADAFTQSDL